MKPCTVLLTVVLLAATATAQDPPSIEVDGKPVSRQTLADVITAFIHITTRPEISGATYRVSGQSGITRMSTLKIPVQTTVELEGLDDRIYLEGSLGYLSAKDSTSALIGDPVNAQSKVEVEWQSLSALVGAGWSFPIGEGLYLTPTLSLGLSWLKNRASYDELGKEVLAPVLDGKLLNWEALALSPAVSLMVEYEGNLDEENTFKLDARYLVAYTTVLDSTDEFQRFDTMSDILLARMNFYGPTGWEVFGRKLDWNAYVNFNLLPSIRDDEFDTRWFFEFGAYLENDMSDLDFLISKLRLGVGFILGDEITGWTIGVGLRF